MCKRDLACKVGCTSGKRFDLRLKVRMKLNLASEKLQNRCNLDENPNFFGLKVARKVLTK